MWSILSPSSEQSPDLARSLSDVRQSISRNLILATVGFALVWHLLMASLWSDSVLVVSLPVTTVVVLASALALYLLKSRFVVAQGAWLAGLLVSITLALWSSGAREIVFLYLFLPLVAAITLSWKGAAVVEVGIVLLMWWLNRGILVEPFSIPHWTVTIAGGLFGGLIGWVVTYSLFTTTQWSLFHYQQAQRRMDEISEQRVEAKQTQEDLLLANRELARLSDRLKAMYRVAEEARRAKEEFVANVSHELRTPLNMIIGFSEMITESPQVYGADLPPALLTDISAIQRNSQHLSRLVDDVLDLSQAEAGRTTLSKEWVSLKEIIDEAAVVVSHLFESKGLYLRTSVSEELPLVFCDTTRISQVVVNLLSNAGRFTERGGVSVTTRHEGENVIISVADTGPGIAPQDLEKLFEPFQQLDSSIRRRHGGSGLGLSISKRFVEMHGGEMWLESQPGIGTTFYFSLPVETPLQTALDDDGVTRWFSPYHQYEARTRRAPALVSEPSARLVMLDPGDTLPRLFSRYTDDVEIVQVNDLDTALDELGRSPAQALIVNASPPEQTSLIERLDNLPYGTPALTCWVPGADATAQRLGIVRYLVKPVGRQDLLSTLSELGHGIETILIVDDEPEALQLFARMLSSTPPGYRILRARSGQRALSLLRERQPDVMLLDLIMPQMDGFQVLEAKSRDPALREIPVVVISSRDPSGEPIVSNALTVIGSHGLSIPQLLACTTAVTEILAPSGQRDRGHSESPGG